MQQFHRERLRRVMAQSGLRALVASTPENLYYATDHWSIANSILRSAVALAVVDEEGSLRGLVLSCGDVANFVAAGYAPEQMWTYGRFFYEGDAAAAAIQAATNRAESGPAEALAQALISMGLDRGRIAVDEGQIPLAAWEAIPRLLPSAEIIAGGSLFRTARLVKGPGEIPCLERAAEIAEDAFMAALKTAGPGMTERELGQRYEGEVVARGGSPFFTVVTFGERAALADTTLTDRALRSGDVIRVDLGAIYKGYRSDIARTAICGDADPRYAAYYRAMLAGLNDGIKAIRPGMTGEQIFEITVQSVRANGVPHYRRQHVGHAIGLEVYDALALAPGVTTPLEQDMVLCVETPYYEIGWGGVQIEDMLQVTSDGARLLNKSSRELLRVNG